MLNLRVRMPETVPIGLVLLSACLAGCGGGASSRTSSGFTPALPVALPSSARTSASVAELGATSAYSSVVIGDRPLSYYRLSDTSSSLVDSGALGVSGVYGSGIVRGAAPITASAASAARFPGGSSYNPNGFAWARPSAGIQPAAVTIEAWIQPSAQNVNHDLPIVIYGDALAGAGYGLYLHGLARTSFSTLSYEQRSGQGRELRVYGTMHLSVGVPYHVVAVSSGSQVRTYVNGVLDQFVSNSGAIDYSAPVSKGIQIGGAASNSTYGSPSFAGTIGQVAIYGSALSGAQIVSHFIAGQRVAMVTERATAADAFVDSIGVNSHLSIGASVDAQRFAQSSGLLIGSGIRHVRFSMNVNSPSFAAEVRQLAASGIHGDYVVPPGATQAQVQKYPALVSPSLETFEAPNEPDDQVGQPYPSWVPGCVAFQRDLYSWVKGNSATSRYRVLGPAMAWPLSIQRVGNISASFDVSNIHNYLGSYNPGNAYANYVVGIARLTSGGKPIVVTETGYGTGYGSPLLDPRMDLRYITRLFLEFFNGGVARSYSYDFIEYGGSSKFGQYGLVQNNLVPKPAYYGIKSLIGALQDPGSAFTPSTLTYRLSGFTNNVHHLLMQKRNGTFVLAVWLEAPGWNSSSATGGEIALPAQTVTLSAAANFASVSKQTLTDSGGLAGSALPWSGNQTTFAVTDSVSLITLTP